MLLCVSEMPLSSHVGVISGILQEKRHRTYAIRQMGLVSGEVELKRTRRPLQTHPRDVVVVARHQHRPRRGAERGRVELREEDSLRGQGVDVRGPDVAAVCPEIGVRQVIRDDQQNVGTRVGNAACGCAEDDGKEHGERSSGHAGLRNHGYGMIHDLPPPAQRP
jgi:hypothetical protein